MVKTIPKGTVFGKLTVVSSTILKDKNGFRHGASVCLCSCGHEITVVNSSLRNGNTKSCGCTRVKKLNEFSYKHGFGKSSNRLFRIWRQMRFRCNDKKNLHYHLRGIRVCEEWNNSFSAFREWALGNGYDDTLSIDRIDPNGNYEPSNCRWADHVLQQRNKTNNNVVTVDGVSLCISEWAEKLGINKSRIHQCCYRKGNVVEYIRGLMK